MVERFWLDRHGELRLSAQGDWVRFIDHEATIATLRAELEEARREIAEYDSANRDIVKRADFWKARAEAAEASLAEVATPEKK